jgi:hypothetical protein
VIDHLAGLDGLYRYNEIPGQGTVAVRGSWLDERNDGWRFAVDYHSIGGAWHTRLILRFDGENLTGTAHTNSGTDIRISGVAAR